MKRIAICLAAFVALVLPAAADEIPPQTDAQNLTSTAATTAAVTSDMSTQSTAIKKRSSDCMHRSTSLNMM